jgi:hypothetical protein
VDQDRLDSPTCALNIRINGGTTFVPIIPTTPNAGSYPWTVPGCYFDAARVRIYDASDLTVSSTSPANFKIQGSFQISRRPMVEKAWQAASDHDITWTFNGSVSTVNLYYSKDSGATWNNIILAIPNSNTYTWTIPVQAVSVNNRVKVADAGDPESFDISNNDFRVRCTFVLTSPNGGEQWRVGQARNITWTKIGDPAAVKIEYSRDNFLVDFQTIAANASPVSPYAWTIPDSIHNNVRVRLSDASDYGARDDSDAVFRITGDFTVTSPNGGEKWEVQSVQAITWTSRGTVTDVTAEYSVNGGTTYDAIQITSNTGTFKLDRAG